MEEKNQATYPNNTMTNKPAIRKRIKTTKSNR